MAECKKIWTNTVLTHHLKLSEYKTAKVAILEAMEPTGLTMDLPRMLSRGELIGLSRATLMKRFRQNNQALKESCEEEIKHFPHIMSLWTEPASVRKRNPEWPTAAKQLLEQAILQEAYYEEQQRIKSVLEDVYGVYLYMT